MSVPVPVSPQVTPLEQAAIDFYSFVASRLGETADYPLHLTTDNDDDMDALLDHLNRLRDRVREVRPDLW